MNENQKTTIIAIANQKGGVGKTSTTINLATAFQKMGKRVLMVDLDPQVSLTVCQGIYFPDELPATISDLIGNEMQNDPEDLDITTYIREDRGIDYIPADLSLSAQEIQMVVVPRREYILKDILSRVLHLYDYILIDCPRPSKS